MHNCALGNYARTAAPLNRPNEQDGLIADIREIPGCFEGRIAPGRPRAAPVRDDDDRTTAFVIERPSLRDRKFVDSLLEGSGFEPLVPRHVSSTPAVRSAMELAVPERRSPNLPFVQTARADLHNQGPPSTLSGVFRVRCCHSLEVGQDRHFLEVLGAETRPVDAHRCGARSLDADRPGWRRDHTERLIGGVAGHGIDHLQIVDGRGDRHRRVTELAQDGEFQATVAFALTTAPPIGCDRDGAADDGVEARHVREGHLP